MPTSESAMDTRSLKLDHLIEAICALVPQKTANAQKAILSLRTLQERLSGERLHLAVLGQFKRGKSTLVNALLGAPIMPAAVVPLTAIPTFVEYGNTPVLRTVARGEVTENFGPLSEETLQRLLFERVTEEGNPNNRQHLSHVGITFLSQLLRGGIVLIDTPGVGSTFRHNTETAEAVLPECDVALFVVSPDPPITEVEVQYLSRIGATASQILVVLNKIDTLGEHDRAASLRFLKRVLETVGLKDVPVFMVTARSALKARADGDDDALEQSGLPKLECFLRDFIATRKHHALATAVARKAAALTGSLRFETDITLAALKMPMHDLEQRLATFESAVSGFETERNAALDMLQGEKSAC
jgi:tRNA U34 5-carboxymethylaminomethyl modifying GTPase MnmE/TrmE